MYSIQPPLLFSQSQALWSTQKLDLSHPNRPHGDYSWHIPSYSNALGPTYCPFLNVCDQPYSNCTHIQKHYKVGIESSSLSFRG